MASMHIEFLVEESSVEAALQVLASKILGPDVSFAVHPHQGKPDLLASLPGLLQGYRDWLPDDWRIVVLLDADEGDCRKLKANLEEMARRARLVTQSTPAFGSHVQVLNRLAVKELEAWFFGDVEALGAAYPGVPLSLARKAKYRNPDAIGKTSVALERELQRAGYYRSGLAKISAARQISQHMDPDRNRSRSFQTFRQGLLELCR
jgi:hypothetical protein